MVPTPARAGSGSKAVILGDLSRAFSCARRSTEGAHAALPCGQRLQLSSRPNGASQARGFPASSSTAEVRARNEPRHRLVSLKDVKRLTGLSLQEVLRRPDTQELVRLGKGGVREQLIRIPVELLTVPPEPAADEAEDTGG